MLDDAQILARRSGLDEAEVRSLLHGGERGRRWTAPLTIRSIVADPQERAADGEGDARAADASGDLVVEGYSAVFDQPSLVLFGWLEERIKRGAFKRVLRERPDVRFLENHTGRAHARTVNETLTLEEKPRGLYCRATFDAERVDSKDLYRAIERGDCSQQSFAFTIAESEMRYCDCVEEQGKDYWGCDSVWQRDILEIGELFEVSAVTFPAYPATSVEVARESERSEERDAPASDQEQRATAPDPDVSPAHPGSDHATAIRLRLIALGGDPHNVTGPEGAARSC
jgi:HK97 family phage prohead protease